MTLATVWVHHRPPCLDVPDHQVSAEGSTRGTEQACTTASSSSPPQAECRMLASAVALVAAAHMHSTSFRSYLNHATWP